MGFFVSHTFQIVGAGLLAKAACQPASLLNDTPLSRASPLPQGIGDGTYIGAG
ncbi:hypothetical protein PMI36_05376 [Pseudomonas sp. GM79]|nr:hypothetical protein PMI36_05376 [Pseudomonas sp. GM79]